MSFDFKNATEEARKIEYNRIAKEIGDDQFFTKKELNYLPEILSNGEQVLAFSSGFMDNSTWLITLTDRRIIFLDKGMLYGLKQSAVELDKVNSVSAQTGLIFGKIIIGEGSTSKTISNVQKKSVVNFTNKVRDAIENRKTQKNDPQQFPKSTSNDDIVSKLERIGNLYEKGILTQEEFNQQKAKILAGE